MREVTAPAVDPSHLLPFLAEDRCEPFQRLATEAPERFAGRTIWNINSTSAGGGVAEMLAQVVAYARGAGVDARWLVTDGTPEFFALTKRLHNRLHGAAGADGDLGATERAIYERTLEPAAEELKQRLRPRDIVAIHDPQPAGLIAAARAAGASVVWRCHIGADRSNEHTEQAWEFLAPYLAEADAEIYSRPAYVRPGAPADRVQIIAPGIDPLAPKNQPMDEDTVHAVLAHIGLIEKAGGAAGRAQYRHSDGSVAEVTRTADIIRDGPPWPVDVPLVVQVSRWDRLKDMGGVLRGFADHVDAGTGAHLALVGPETDGVSDDPEGQEVLAECEQVWRGLPADTRRRIALVCLPMSDLPENAAMVNAAQRHARLVVQKSLAEGFGLTVSEAMWKSRPVLASRAGGIVDQVTEDCGVLLDDPTDLAVFGTALTAMLGDGDGMAAMGEACLRHVQRNFLPDRHVGQWYAVLSSLGG